jgi:EpsI family protein
VAYYWQQGPESKLIAWNNRLHDGQYWRYLTRGADAAVVDGAPIRVVSERLAGAAGERRLVWYFYWVDGQFLSQPWMAKLLQAKAQLLGGDRRSAVVAFSAVESGLSGKSGAVLRDALQAAVDQQPAITEMLKAAARGDTPGRACS